MQRRLLQQLHPLQEGTKESLLFLGYGYSPVSWLQMLQVVCFLLLQVLQFSW